MEQWDGDGNDNHTLLYVVLPCVSFGLSVLSCIVCFCYKKKYCCCSDGRKRFQFNSNCNLNCLAAVQTLTTAMTAWKPWQIDGKALEVRPVNWVAPRGGQGAVAVPCRLLQRLASPEMTYNP